LIVRAAEASDAAAIARVHVESWRIGYRGLLADELLAQLSVEERARTWRARLAEENPRAGARRVDVAAVGESVLGFVASGPSREQDATARNGEIYAIYVHPDHWSMGVGQALIGSAVAHLTAIGASDMLIWVLSGNSSARRFYELAGWAWDGRARTKRLADPPGFDSEVEEVSYRRELS
jgi:GNAT superfamily N-acetyltransferase